MAKRQRYILEGTWSQTHRVYHRQIIYKPGLYRDLKSIMFDDGTVLRLSIREAKPYEKVYLIPGYNSLIDSCIRHNVNSVEELKRIKAK